MTNRKQRRGLAREQARKAEQLRGTARRPEASPDAVLAAAHRLFELGRLREALPSLRRACAAAPDHLGLHAALAYALAGSGALEEAVEAYRKLLALDPGSAPLRTNLAVLLLRTGAVEDARALLLEAAELAPDHANTASALGDLFARLRDREQAFGHYRRAIDLYRRQIGPRPTAAHCNDLVKLATAQMWTGDTGAALANFDRAVALRPDHALALARRGLLLARLRRFPEAVASLRRAAAAKPNYAEARRAIGDLLLESGEERAARSQYRAALRANPRDAVARYFLAAASHESPDAPPPEYVARLFDDYADRFEKHLVEVLQYRAPELLWAAVADAAQPQGADWTVIDLGCGTGLAGRLARPFAARLTGVDLSADMLAKAREKDIYDELIEGDLTAALLGHAGDVDLVMAADVFVYLGNLAPVLAAARKALRPGGFMAFTVESLEGDSFRLSPTGRYQHSPGYVEGEAKAQGLSVVRREQVVLRYQSRRPVMGDVYVMRPA